MAQECCASGRRRSRVTRLVDRETLKIESLKGSTRTGGRIIQSRIVGRQKEMCKTGWNIKGLNLKEFPHGYLLEI